MPQPEVLDQLQQPLIDAYRTAWLRIQAEQERLVLDPLAYRRKIRLTEVQKSIEAAMEGLDEAAGEWVANQLPRVMLQGASSVVPEATWNLVQQEALQELSTNLFNELLSATANVRDSTKQLVRAIGRDEALQKAIVGKTAEQAATEMRRVLESKGIYSVIYSNGTKHGLAEYTQVAMRTTTAKAYNRGALGAAPEVKYWEVFDGPNCGLTYHDDPQLAMGMVIGREEAEKYIISHPNCRRAFGARPDITRSDLAAKADPTTTPEQRRAQLEQDAARGDKEAIRELAGDKRRQDVFDKRQARLDAQKERYRQADRRKAEADRLARQAARDEKLRLEEAERVKREAERAAAQAILDEQLRREAEIAARAAADTFPDLPKLAEPMSYRDSYKRDVVNPGVARPERRNNCHFVAPAMEMRARGYDVVASQTFRTHGRLAPSISSDWIDPATGTVRGFRHVSTTHPFSPKTGAKKGFLTQRELEEKMELETQDWPDGARGFIIGAWKQGGAHIWNVTKEEGRLAYFDGQVSRTAREYLSDCSTLQLMRVDDQIPVAERVRIAVEDRERTVSKRNQARVGLRLFRQVQDDWQNGATAYRSSYNTMMYDIADELKQFGVPDAWNPPPELL